MRSSIERVDRMIDIPGFIHRGDVMITDDVRKNRTTVVGGAHHVTWPGHGLVFGEVGRVVHDWTGTPDDVDDDDLVFAAGIHQDSMARDLLCELVS